MYSTVSKYIMLTQNGNLQNLEPRKCRPKSFGEVHDNYNWIECSSAKNPDHNYYYNVRSHDRTWTRPVPENVDLPFYNPHAVAQQTSDNENESSPPVSDLDDTYLDDEEKEIEKQYQDEKRFLETASKLFYHGSRHARRTRRILEDIPGDDSDIYETIPITDFLQLDYLSEDSAKRLRSSSSSSSDSVEDSSTESTKESSSSSCHCSCCEVKNNDSDNKSQSCGSSISHQSISSNFSAPRLKQITFSDLMTEPRNKLRRKRKKCKIDPSKDERKPRLTPEKIICDMYGIRTVSYDPIFEYINPTLPIDVQPACLTDSSISPDRSETVPNNDMNSFFDLPLQIRDPILSEVSSGSETAEPIEELAEYSKEVSPSKIIWRPWTENNKTYEKILGGKVLCVKLQRIDMDKNYFGSKNKKDKIKDSEVEKGEEKGDSKATARSKENLNEKGFSEGNSETETEEASEAEKKDHRDKTKVVNSQKGSSEENWDWLEDCFAENNSIIEDSKAEGHRRRFRPSTNYTRYAKIYVELDTDAEEDIEIYRRPSQKSKNRKRTTRRFITGLSESEEQSKIEKRVERAEPSKGNVEQEKSFVEANMETEHSERGKVRTDDDSKDASVEISKDTEAEDFQIDRRSLQSPTNMQRTIKVCLPRLTDSEEEQSKLEKRVKRDETSEGNVEQEKSFVQANVEAEHSKRGKDSSNDDLKDAIDGSSTDTVTEDFEIDRTPLQKFKNRKRRTRGSMKALSSDTEEEQSEIEKRVERHQTCKKNSVEENMETEHSERGKDSSNDDCKDASDESSINTVTEGFEINRRPLQKYKNCKRTRRFIKGLSSDTEQEDSKDTNDGSSRDGSDENSSDGSYRGHQDKSDEKSADKSSVGKEENSSFGWVIVNSHTNKMRLKKVAVSSESQESEQINLNTDFDEELKEKLEAQEESANEAQKNEVIDKKTEDLKDSQTNSGSPESEKINYSKADFEEEVKENQQAQEESTNKARQKEVPDDEIGDLRIDSQINSESLENEKTNSNMNFEEVVKEIPEAQEESESANNVRDNEGSDKKFEDLRDSQTNFGSPENDNKDGSKVDFEKATKEKPETQEESAKKYQEVTNGKADDLRVDFERREVETTSLKIKDSNTSAEMISEDLIQTCNYPESLNSFTLLSREIILEDKVNSSECLTSCLLPTQTYSSKLGDKREVIEMQNGEKPMELDKAVEFLQNEDSRVDFERREVETCLEVNDSDTPTEVISEDLILEGNSLKSLESCSFIPRESILKERVNSSKNLTSCVSVTQSYAAELGDNKGGNEAQNGEKPMELGKAEELLQNEKDLRVDFERREVEKSLEVKDSNMPTEVTSEDLIFKGDSLESLDVYTLLPRELVLKDKANSSESLSSCFSLTQFYSSKLSDKKAEIEMQNGEKRMELDEKEEFLQMDFDKELLPMENNKIEGEKPMDLDEDLSVIENENSPGEKRIDPIIGEEIKGLMKFAGIGKEDKRNEGELSGIDDGDEPELILFESESEEELTLIESRNKELSGTEKGKDKNMDVDEDLSVIENENSPGEKRIDPIIGEEIKGTMNFAGIGKEDKSNEGELSGIDNGNEPELILIESESEEELTLIESRNKELSGTEKGKDKNMDVDEELSKSESCSTVLLSRSSSENEDDDTTVADEKRIFSEADTVLGDEALESWSSDRSSHDSGATEIFSGLDYD